MGDRGPEAQIIFGGDELANGVLKIKRLSDHVEVSVPRDQIVAEVAKLLGPPATRPCVVVS